MKKKKTETGVARRPEQRGVARAKPKILDMVHVRRFLPATRSCTALEIRAQMEEHGLWPDDATTEELEDLLEDNPNVEADDQGYRAVSEERVFTRRYAYTVTRREQPRRVKRQPKPPPRRTVAPEEESSWRAADGQVRIEGGAVTGVVVEADDHLEMAGGHILLTIKLPQEDLVSVLTGLRMALDRKRTLRLAQRVEKEFWDRGEWRVLNVAYEPAADGDGDTASLTLFEERPGRAPIGLVLPPMEARPALPPANRTVALAPFRNTTLATVADPGDALAALPGSIPLPAPEPSCAVSRQVLETENELEGCLVEDPSEDEEARLHQLSRAISRLRHPSSDAFWDALAPTPSLRLKQRALVLAKEDGWLKPEVLAQDAVKHVCEYEHTVFLPEFARAFGPLLVRLAMQRDEYWQPAKDLVESAVYVAGDEDTKAVQRALGCLAVRAGHWGEALSAFERGGEPDAAYEAVAWAKALAVTATETNDHSEQLRKIITGYCSRHSTGAEVRAALQDHLVQALVKTLGEKHRDTLAAKAEHLALQAAEADETTYVCLQYELYACGHGPVDRLELVRAFQAAPDSDVWKAGLELLCDDNLLRQLVAQVSPEDWAKLRMWESLEIDARSFGDHDGRLLNRVHAFWEKQGREAPETRARAPSLKGKRIVIAGGQDQTRARARDILRSEYNADDVREVKPDWSGRVNEKTVSETIRSGDIVVEVVACMHHDISNILTGLKKSGRAFTRLRAPSQGSTGIVRAALGWQ